MALSNMYSLMTDREGIRSRFEKVVVGDLSRDVERQMQVTANWMLDRRCLKKEERGEKSCSNVLLLVPSPSAAQLHRASEILSTGSGGRVGASGSGDGSRGAVAREVGETAARALEGFGERDVAARLANRLREAAVQVAAIEVGALGIAGIVGAAVLDVTGEARCLQKRERREREGKKKRALTV